MVDCVPDGWVKKLFGEVVKKVNDKVDLETSDLSRYVAGEHMTSNDLKIRSWGTVGDGYLGPAFHMGFKPGHVLYGSRRTYLRKVALPHFEGICANTTFVLDTKDSGLMLQEYLPLIMQLERFHEFSELNSKGSVNPYVNFSDLAAYEFVLPPMDVQKRIVTIVEAVNDHLDALEKALEKIRIVRMRTLSTLLTSPKENWTVKNLSELCEMRKGISYKSDELANEGDGMPFINLKSVAIGGGYRSDGLKWYSGEYKETQIVQPGQLLICCTDITREKAVIGCPIRVPVDERYEDYCISLDLLALDVDEQIVHSDFLFLALQERRLRQFMQKNSRGTTVMHLRIKAVPNASIVLPPLSEQNRIVEEIELFDNLVGSLETRVELVKELRQALLSDLLSGSREIPESFDELEMTV